MRCMSLIIMIILCLSCVGEDCVGTGAGQVTVIFKDAPEQRSTDRIGHLNCVHGAIIAYVDSVGREMGFNPRSIGYDTLDVPTYHGYAEIIHLYQACEEIPFLLPEGDSVMVTYDQDARPVMRSLSNDEYTRLYRLPESVPGLVHRNGYSFRSVLRNPRFRAAEKYLTDSESQRKYPGLEKILMSIMLILIRLKTCTITGEIAFPRNWIHFHKQENADENILAGTGRRCLKMGALPVASNNQTAYCTISPIFIN